jgi:hypothetical protein
MRIGTTGLEVSASIACSDYETVQSTQDKFSFQRFFTLVLESNFAAQGQRAVHVTALSLGGLRQTSCAPWCVLRQ